MSIKKILLLATCLSLGACSTQEQGGYGNGRPHLLADNSSVYASNYGHQNREHCQMYERDVTKMAYVPRCMRHLIHAPPEPATVAYTAPETVLQPAPDTSVLLPITRSYPVYFGFDKSSINADEMATLDEMSNDMKKYRPPQVTITGHTDRAGSADYNQALSARRAQAVSQELTNRGIEHRIIDEQARGETQSAVDTADGVREQANRRAIIDFRGEVLQSTGNR
jgi:outer membrane protein OmpA-like peptidoglycan-associated protein